MKDAQETVQDAIDQMVESGAETGLRVAVHQNGEPVVDATAGVADRDTGRPVTNDTLFYAASVGKGMTDTLAHILAERGELDYDTRSPRSGRSSPRTARARPPCATR